MGKRSSPFNGWDEFVGEAVEILGRHESVKEAVREMSEVLGFPLKVSNLKEAFRARGLETPGSYLRQNNWTLRRKGKVHTTERDHKPLQVFETPVPSPQHPPVQPGPEIPERIVREAEETGNPIFVDVQDFSILYDEPPVQKGERRWLIVSDFHIPWTDWDAYQQCLFSDFAQQCNGIVFGGDMLDNEQFSKHERKDDRPLRMHYETMCERVIKPALTLPNIDEVRILAGNHDNWTVRYGGTRVKPDAFFLIRDKQGHDLMEVIGRVKVNVPDKRLHYRFGPENWWTLIGDMIVAHPTQFLSPGQQGRPGRTVWDRLKWFWKRRPFVRCLVIGHTHRCFREQSIPAIFAKEVLTMECGCMQTIEGAEYTQTGKSNYDPFHVGWAEVVQVDGVTDFERSRFVHLKTV